MTNKRTLIIGSGKHAILAAEALIKHDINVFLCAKDKVSDALRSKGNENLHVYENTHVVSSKGCIGDFHVTLNANGSQKTLNISNILIAEEITRIPSYEPYRLNNSFSVTSLSDVDDIMAETVTDIQQTAAFLTGISYESHPLILEEVMRTAMSLQTKPNSQVYIFTGNLKVAQNGLEAMYRESRKQGVIYIKCAESPPEITQTKYGSVSIKFLDDISCEWFSLKPDIIIVDETIQPDTYLNHLSKVFGLDKDESGFLQTENVHRTPLFTNVRGVLTAGPSRRIQSDHDHIKEMDIACEEVLSMFEINSDETIHKAEIIKGNCIHCLTCYRICPYKAISLNTLPVVMPDACEGCGICASQCPRKAIIIEHLTDNAISEKLTRLSRSKPAKTFSPNIVAFCCSRSAVISYYHARLAGYKIPKGLKIADVPCGGAISMEHILFALKSGADGVMVVTCHDGNCHGERGNQFALSNTIKVQDVLSQAGIGKERVKFMTIASNMGAAFAEESIAFNKQIIELGPSKLIR